MISQRGGFAVGLIVGLLLGLTLALGVALYVTKVPVPFINKVPQRTADQDAAETERNKNWDPNAPLANKPAGKAAPASEPTAAAPSATRTPPAAAATPAAMPAKPAASAAVAKSTKPGTDAFMYFVQVGAYARREDAEQQHARIGLLGMPAKVSEREQSGRTVYRVRLGPFDRKDEADAVQSRLTGNGVEAALVRVER
jgi:cell division protein FtsN